MIDQNASRIQTIANALLDAVLARGTFDLVDDLAFPLPVIVIATLLGVEPEHRDDFKRWSDEVVNFTAGTPHGASRAQYQQSWEEFKAYFSDMIEARRRAPRDDLISLLVKAQEEQDVLSTMEILNFCQLLLVAGNETTTNLLSNAVLALCTHPQQAQQLRQQPALLPSLVEEVLRYDSPVQLVFRTTTCDTEIHGTTIPAHSKVALLWGSANHDPEVFAGPERFDITRTPNPHVAFGYGIHYCLGAPLARLETRLAMEALLHRLRLFALAPHYTCERLEHPLLRGLKHLPLQFEPA
jgi:cytochrome P450